MNDNGYKIMNIVDGHDSRFGSICVVRANPVIDNGFSMGYSTTITDETETFFFPDNESMINQIVRIAQGGGLWYPNEDDFREERIRNEENQKVQTIYRHISFFVRDYDQSLNSGRNVCLIPNMGYKIQTLKEQFYTGYWFQLYVTFRDYVQSLAEGNDVENFWGWLFERQELNGLKPWDLSGEYQREYNRFLDACSEVDDTEY